MPTVFSHPAPLLCLGLACGRRSISWRLLFAGAVCSILPDLDVIGFKLGVAYADSLGHRGLSHSLLFALGAGLLAASAAPLLRATRALAFLVCAGGVLSHIALDAMTNGGLGVALFWPYSDARYFFSWRPIQVSPLSLRLFLSRGGLDVLTSEALLVWLPSLAGMAAIALFRGGAAFISAGRPGPCRKTRQASR